MRGKTINAVKANRRILKAHTENSHYNESENKTAYTCILCQNNKANIIRRSILDFLKCTA